MTTAPRTPQPTPEQAQKPQLARRLKELRRELRISQADAAAAMGVSRQSYSFYESARRLPPLSALEQLCQTYDVTLSHLLGDLLGPSPEATRPRLASTPALPVRSFAECGMKGWYQEAGTLAIATPRPADLSDPEAFAVMAVGTSLLPEGVKPGFICICSPAAPINNGDLVFALTRDDKACLKILSGQDDTWITLQGWLPPAGAGNEQQPYTERHRREHIQQLAAVIYVKRKL